MSKTRIFASPVWASLSMGALLLLLAFPTPASANAITRVSAEVHGEQTAVTFHGESTLSSPRVRVEPGVVRVWFPDTSRTSRFDQRDLGHGVGTVHVKPGASATTLAEITVQTRRPLHDDDLALVMHGATATLELPTALLFVPGTTPIETPPAEAATPQANAAGTADSNARSASAAPAATPTARNASAQPRETPLFPDDTAKPASRNAQLGTEGTSRGTLGLLALITVALGLVFAAVKIIAHGRARKSPGTQIQILSAHRLGARHQLLVVRALGRDHLLSVQGGETRRIASAPADAYASPEAARDENGEDEQPGLTSTIRALLGGAYAKNASKADEGLANPPRIKGKNAPQPEFAPELRRAFSRPTTLHPPAPAAPSVSESVAGLVRLRGQGRS